jgi:hypothetical protein
VDLPARTDSPGDTDGSAGLIWPSPDYSHQVERLKAAVGEVLGQPVPGTDARLEGPRQMIGQDDGDGEAVPPRAPPGA